MQNIQVILLVGGASTRFWPLGEKPLMQFCGKTLFEYQIEMLEECGLNNICVVASQNNVEALKALRPNLKYTIQTTPLGMAGALLDSAEIWQGQEIIIMSANDVIEKSGLEKLLKNTQNDGSLLAQKVTHYFPGGYLEVENNKIKSIIEKPEIGKEPSDLVNLVFHYHKDSAHLLELLKETKSSKDDIYEVCLHQLFQEKNYTAVEYDGFWQALKYPWHALLLSRHFLNKLPAHTGENVQIAETAVIKGNVFLGDNVKIFDHAVIAGPAYIGAGSIIGNNALVRESDLQKNCVVGYNTEVARSLWQENVQTHMNYTGDSILSSGVSLGAGVKTANYRLDTHCVNSIVKGAKISTHMQKFGAAIGKNVHVGIDCSIAPGIKIGNNSLISSHILVNQDLEDNKFLYLKHGEKIIVPNRETKI